MSRDNVQIARDVFDALNSDDPPAALRQATPDFVFDFSRSRGLDGGVYGRDDWLKRAEAILGVWESVRWESEEFIEAPDDRLVTVQTAYMRGRDDIVVPTRGAWLWLFRGGMIARITFFQERREALQAAGLPE